MLVDMYGRGDLQVFVKMRDVADRPGCFEVDSLGCGLAAISTSHRVFKRMLENVMKASASDFVPALSLTCLGFEDGADPRKLQLQVTSPRFVSILSCTVVAKGEVKPALAKGCISLPFGLSLDPADIQPVAGLLLLSSDDEAELNENDRDKENLDSEPEQSEVDAEEEPPPLPPPLLPPRGPPAGVIDMEKAASGRSRCFVCGDAIPIRSFRFNYQLKASTSLRDCKRVHPHCMGRLPIATRAADFATVRRILASAVVEDEVQVLENVVDALRPYAAAVGSASAT
jgi:hypothetical protein